MPGFVVGSGNKHFRELRDSVGRLKAQKKIAHAKIGLCSIILREK